MHLETPLCTLCVKHAFIIRTRLAQESIKGLHMSSCHQKFSNLQYHYVSMHSDSMDVLSYQNP